MALLKNNPQPKDIPSFWDTEVWHKMITKPYKQRLIIAGALIAAQLDLIQYVLKNSPASGTKVVDIEGNNTECHYHLHGGSHCAAICDVCKKH